MSEPAENIPGQVVPTEEPQNEEAVPEQSQTGMATMSEQQLNSRQLQNLECKSLYVGNLSPVVNQALLHEAFAASGQITSVKVIADKAVCLNERNSLGFC
jgi:RNA recognition motif-containing protein